MEPLAIALAVSCKTEFLIFMMNLRLKLVRKGSRFDDCTVINNFSKLKNLLVTA